MERRRTPGYTRESVIALLAVRHLRDEGKLKIDIIGSYECSRDHDVAYGICEASKPNGDSANLQWFVDTRSHRIMIQRESGRDVAQLFYRDSDAKRLDLRADWQPSIPFVAVAA